MNIFVKAFSNNKLVQIFNVDNLVDAIYYASLSRKCGANKVTVCKRSKAVRLVDEIRKESPTL